MNTEPNIHEQSLHYFLQEAPELLQAIETELLSLQQDYSINKIYNLMRITHTLKGAAASVGLEVLKTVAHSWEDIFRAICQPELTIDSELTALLFEGYECLRLPVTAALTDGQVNDAEILDRTAAVFTQLQAKLGDCFGQEAYLPSSQELGFDLTGAIFELGVTQRLDELTTAINSGDVEVVGTTLRLCAEVFCGLAQSLKLPEWGAISQMTIAALDTHPDNAIAIAQTALDDFQQAQVAILAGTAYAPSQALQQLSQPTQSKPARKPRSKRTTTTTTKKTRSQKAKQPDTQETAAPNVLLEAIWGSPGETETPANPPLIPSPTEAVPDEIIPFPPPEITESTPLTTTKEQVSRASIRVNVENLEHLNYSIGELLTNQNRQSLQHEQLQTAVKVLLSRLQQHHLLLEQLQDWSETIQNPALNYSTKLPLAITKNLDRLELYEYNQAQILVQSIQEDAVQLTEAADAIALFTQASYQTVEKQRRLTNSTRDALIAARMSPLSELLGRFPIVIQQLETTYNKQVTLEMRGAEVLVDKQIVEKLYDPLLHLIRNATAHGIEPSAVRRIQGKPAPGNIEISAHQQGKHLVITVRDDGQGLDFDRIRAVATHQLIPNATSLTPSQLTDLLFEPGFSTSDQVNDLSGRGIGLNAVRVQLQNLQGVITVTSEQGCGTTFTLQIPLSLTIAKLLLAQAGLNIYALFVDTIEQIIIPKPDQLQAWEGGKVLRWGQGEIAQLIPIYQLSQTLNYTSHHPSVSTPPTARPLFGEIMPVILIRCQTGLVGLEVDQLLGEQELVIRPLGQMITPPDYIYGGSILPDGRLTLVLDGAALIQYMLNPQTLPTELPPPTDHFPAHTETTVLVVDDSITVRQTLALTLQKAGYQVLQAKDGYEAIAQLSHHPNIELVLCDIEMPRMNGFEFLKHRQQQPNLANIPVIILSSRSGKKHRLIAGELGATAYITKPYLEHSLLTTVKDIIAPKTPNPISV